MRINVLRATALLLLFGVPAFAQVIDFETTPGGGASVDNAPLGLNDGYSVGSVTVTFGFDTDQDGVTETEALFEQAGGTDPDRGFAACLGDDAADAGFEAQLGQFFLRQPGTGTPFGDFVIDYTSATIVTAASGEIWDIDGVNAANSEEYTVTATDNDGAEFTVVSPEHDTVTCAGPDLDGEPWVFSFSNVTAGIDRITIRFTGTKPGAPVGPGIGLAFNNFNATESAGQVPATSAWGLGALGLLLAAGLGILLGAIGRRGNRAVAVS